MSRLDTYVLLARFKARARRGAPMRSFAPPPPPSVLPMAQPRCHARAPFLIKRRWLCSKNAFVVRLESGFYTMIQRGTRIVYTLAKESDLSGLCPIESPSSSVTCLSTLFFFRGHRAPLAPAMRGLALRARDLDPPCCLPTKIIGIYWHII